MRIAQIAPLSLNVPPSLYGGTERIVSHLTEELVRLGHEVTLFATANSVSSARLISSCDQALWLNPAIKNGLPYYMIMLELAHRMASEFDVMHFHIEQLHFPVFSSNPRRTLTTLHCRQDLPEMQKLYDAFPEMPLVPVSNCQRAQIQGGNVLGIVPHGIPAALHTPNFTPRGGYLAFLGRISPEKRVDRAVAIARNVGLPLKIAGLVYPSDEKYFAEHIEPLLSGPGVEFIGEIDDRAKSIFLGEALALLFPVDWPEPFGLVMIEAMACATPVLAFHNGAVPEVVDDGVTGYVVPDIDQAAQIMPKLLALNRVKVRHRFEDRFTAERMALNYITLYEKLENAAADGM